MYLKFGKYRNDRLVIELIDAKDESPALVATVNLPNVNLGDKEIIIKDYSENEGVLKALQEKKIVGPIKRNIPTGWVLVPVVDLLITPLDEYKWE